MPGPKTNNNRRFPEANHQPRNMASFRKADAVERQAAYDKLTLEEKLAKLPPEPASKKQRARLLALLEKQNAPKQDVLAKQNDADAVTVDAATKPKTNQKKYMKGSK